MFGFHANFTMLSLSKKVDVSNWGIYAVTVGPVGIRLNVYVSKYIGNNVILLIISIREVIRKNKMEGGDGVSSSINVC